MTIFKCNNVDTIIEVCPASLIAQNEHIGMSINKEDVDSNNYDNVFRQFEEFRKAGIAAGNKLTIIFEGYDDDPRDIWQIPEIRGFVEIILCFYPELLFYLYDVTRQPILSCLLDMGISYKDNNGGTYTEIPKTKENALTILRLITNARNHYHSLNKQ